jgi:hypothetical protein
VRGVAVRGEVLVQRDEVLALEGSSRDGVGERLGQEDLRRLNSKQNTTNKIAWNKTNVKRQALGRLRVSAGAENGRGSGHGAAHVRS